LHASTNVLSLETEHWLCPPGPVLAPNHKDESVQFKLEFKQLEGRNGLASAPIMLVLPARFDTGFLWQKFCELTGKRPIKAASFGASGQVQKKAAAIGTHVHRDYQAALYAQSAAGPKR